MISSGSSKKIPIFLPDHWLITKRRVVSVARRVVVAARRVVAVTRRVVAAARRVVAAARRVVVIAWRVVVIAQRVVVVAYPMTNCCRRLPTQYTPSFDVYIFVYFLCFREGIGAVRWWCEGECQDALEADSKKKTKITFKTMPTKLLN